MGNNTSSEQVERVHGVENIKNIDLNEKECQQTTKKKSVFFGGFTWKKLAETTRKNKNNKNSKVKPSSSGDDVHRQEISKGAKNDSKKQTIFYINENLNQRSDQISKCYPENIGKYLEADKNDIKTAQIDQKLARHHNNHHDETKLKSYKSELAPVNTTTTSNTTNSGKPRKIVIQASTSELLRCLGEFVCRRCKFVDDLKPNDVVAWLRGVDRNLIAQGWQDVKFVMPSSVVFMFMLCRENVSKNARTRFEVQCSVLTCLYLSYSYMGNEISYPLRPFLLETDRYVFWERCCQIMSKMSGKMLRINRETHFFTSLFRELTTYSTALPPSPPTTTTTTTTASGHRVWTAA